MLLLIGIVLLVAWIFFAIFIPLMGLMIHLALIVGLVLVILHFLTRARR